VEKPDLRQGKTERAVRRWVRRFHTRPPKSVNYSSGRWQVVDVDGHVYVFSAFYDSRPNLDWPHVRIIGVAEYDVRIYKLCCLLWYSSRRRPDVAEITVTEVGGKYIPRSQPMLGQYIFSCRASGNGTDPPDYVSLVAPRAAKLSNLLAIEVPKPAREVAEFGLCAKTLYGTQDAFRLVEWLEAHRTWGVGEVNFYAAASVDNVTDAVLRSYAPFVRYRRASGPLAENSDAARRLGMSAAINDCMYRNLYRYRYVLCTDVDELIVPASPHRSYTEMLAAADAAATRSNAVVHSYYFRNTYFFLDFAPTEKKPFYMLTQRFLYAAVFTCQLGPFHGAIAVLSVTRCCCRCRCRRCRRGHRCAGGVRQYR